MQEWGGYSVHPSTEPSYSAYPDRVTTAEMSAEMDDESCMGEPTAGDASSAAPRRRRKQIPSGPAGPLLSTTPPTPPKSSAHTPHSQLLFLLCFGGWRRVQSLAVSVDVPAVSFSVPAHTTWLGTGPVLLTHQKSCLPPVLRSLHPFIMGEMRPLSWGANRIKSAPPRPHPKSSSYADGPAGGVSSDSAELLKPLHLPAKRGIMPCPSNIAFDLWQSESTLCTRTSRRRRMRCSSRLPTPSTRPRLAQSSTTTSSAAPSCSSSLSDK